MQLPFGPYPCQEVERYPSLLFKAKQIQADEEDMSAPPPPRRSELHNRYDEYLKFYSSGILNDTEDQSCWFVEPVSKCYEVSTGHRKFLRSEINIQNIIKLSEKDYEWLSINEEQVKGEDKDTLAALYQSSISSQPCRDLNTCGDSIGESRLMKWEENQKLVSIFDPFSLSVFPKLDDDLTTAKQGNLVHVNDDIIPEKSSERPSESSANVRTSSSENAATVAASNSRDLAGIGAKSNNMPKMLWGFWNSKKVSCLF